MVPVATQEEAGRGGGEPAPTLGPLPSRMRPLRAYYLSPQMLSLASENLILSKDHSLPLNFGG
jgi:hypothetical protein